MSRQQRRQRRIARENEIRECLKGKILSMVKAGYMYDSSTALVRDFRNCYKACEIPQEKQLWVKARDAVLQDFWSSYKGVKNRQASLIASGYACLINFAKAWK